MRRRLSFWKGANKPLNYCNTHFLVDQTLRLADGYRKGEGRVEIFHDGYWGTVCNDYWDIKDAQVVCRQLGYSKTLKTFRFSTFGKGNGHIWLIHLRCSGNESSIENCQHRGWNNHHCSHSEDVSVICLNGTKTLGKLFFLGHAVLLLDQKSFLQASRRRD